MKTFIVLIGFLTCSVYGQSTPYILNLFEAEKTCGKGTSYPKYLTSKRLTGNALAAKANWGWHVLIKKNGNFVCSGALIHENWVITTANCVFNTNLFDITLEFGVRDREANDNSVMIRTASKIIIHVGFTQAQLRNNIAMIKLNEKISFDYGITNVCIPNGQQTYEGRYGYLTGYGSQYSGGPISRHLKQLYIPHLANSVCRGLSSYYTYPIDTNFQICAGGPNQDFCDGDSGSPFVILGLDGRWHFVGLASFTRNTCGDGGVYTKVSQYIDFIYNTIQS